MAISNFPSRWYTIGQQCNHATSNWGRYLKTPPGQEPSSAGSSRTSWALPSMSASRAGGDGPNTQTSCGRGPGRLHQKSPMSDKSLFSPAPLSLLPSLEQPDDTTLHSDDQRRRRDLRPVNHLKVDARGDTESEENTLACFRHGGCQGRNVFQAAESSRKNCRSSPADSPMDPGSASHDCATAVDVAWWGTPRDGHGHPNVSGSLSHVTPRELISRTNWGFEAGSDSDSDSPSFLSAISSWRDDDGDCLTSDLKSSPSPNSSSSEYFTPGSTIRCDTSPPLSTRSGLPALEPMGRPPSLSARAQRILNSLIRGAAASHEQQPSTQIGVGISDLGISAKLPMNQGHSASSGMDLGAFAGPSGDLLVPVCLSQWRKRQARKGASDLLDWKWYGECSIM